MSKIEWIQINSLDELISLNKDYILLFKHSPRCIVSRISLSRFELGFDKKINQLNLVLKDIEQRDNNIYRVLFETNPIPNEVRKAGFGGINRYENLEGFENSDLVVETTKKIEILTPKDFNLKSPKENGKTFAENSFIKAKYYSKKTNMVCIADDSGIEIDILNKAPGIYSARWGGKKGNFNLAMNKVYNELSKKSKNWQNKKIKARFICALSICFLDKNIACVKGKVEGFISPEPKGKKGFGYDPIFIPINKKQTFGEMNLSLIHI